MARRRIAVLISGSGSNLQALLDDAARAGRHSSIELVLSNNPSAYGLIRAEQAGIEADIVDHRIFPDRASFEFAIEERLQGAQIDIVCLAGFMRVLTTGFVERWRDRLVNIHPSLLPAFPGLHTHARAIAAGVQVTGCTVHFVRSEVDTGPIIAQGLVRVRDQDTPDLLSRRVLSLEHRLYPLALELVAAGRLCLKNERIRALDEAAQNSRLLLEAGFDLPSPRI
jgi:phosphoribosylglycinamide formyltransferase 1